MDRVEAAIEEAIASGRLPDGSALTETELAEALGVSRSPIRDALKRLTYKGLVEPRARRGLVVAGFSQEQILDFFHLREALEGLAARLAAERMVAEDVRAVRQHLDAVERELSAGSRGYPSADDDFHARILRGASSMQLNGAMDAIAARVRLLRRRSGAARRRARAALTEHRAILAAVEAHDAAAAEAGMRQHIRNARENLLKTPQGEEQP